MTILSQITEYVKTVAEQFIKSKILSVFVFVFNKVQGIESRVLRINVTPSILHLLVENSIVICLQAICRTGQFLAVKMS